jgi:hypothetical protein
MHIPHEQGAKAWFKTLIIGGFGGGIAGAVAAIADPTKYRFPQDVGTGKLWPFFFQGAFLTIGALCLKSPFGINLTTSLKDAQKQLRESKETIAETKAALKDQEETKGD